MPTFTPTPTVEENDFVSNEGYLSFNAWFVVFLFLLGSSWLVYWAFSRFKSTREGIRWAVCVLLGGAAAYTYLTLGLPGSQAFASAQGMSGILIFTVLGELTGAVCAWLWIRRATAAKSPTN